MSYNIMGKNASFKGDVSGTIENQVNDWDNQTIGGTKTFTNTINSSADVMLSGSGKVSASFFYGDGTNLSGVGGTPGGSNRDVQFNNSGAFSGSANFKFTAANELQVAGQISASLGVSGSEFHGDGSNLTAVTASFVTASNVGGILNASQINLGQGLEDNSNAVRVKLTAANSGLNLAPAGVSLNINNLSTKGGYTNTDKIAVYDGATTQNLQLSVLEAALDIDGNQITGVNSIDPQVLPNEITHATKITASIHVSASAFFGDGSALKNVSTAPAGANTQVQFNDAGSAAGNSAFTFSKTTGLMTVTTGSFSKISSSLIPDTTDHFYLGAPDLSVRWANIASVGGNFSDRVVMATGSVIHRLGVGTVNPQNELEVTGTAVVIGNISASANVSASAFYGSGANLTNTINSIDNYAANRMLVAGGDVNNIDAVTQVTFNNPNFAVDGNISASIDLEVGGHITASGDLNIAGTGDIADTLTLSKASGDGLVVTSTAKFNGNVQLGNAAGDLLQPLGRYASDLIPQNQTKNLGSSGINWKEVYALTGSFVNLSASSDLQVGGDISGSGDLRLLNDGNIRLGGGSRISFDDGNGINTALLQPGTNQFQIEAHNSLLITTDNYFVINDENNDTRLFIDLRQAQTPDNSKLTLTDLTLSSSHPISASALHTNGGITAPGPGGDINVLDSNGNLNVGSITMADGAGPLNFGNNEISGSGNISASFFHGDGSNLTGIGGSTTFEDHIKTSSYFQFNGATFWVPLAGNNPGSRNQLDNVTFQRWGGIHYVAPASGSLKRFKMIAFNNADTIYSATPNKYDIILTLSKNDATTSAANATRAPHGHITASANTYVVASGSFGLVWDIPIVGNGEFSGSNTFDPGDVLKMTNRFAAIGGPGGSNNYDNQMTITFELSGSDD